MLDLRKRFNFTKETTGNAKPEKKRVEMISRKSFFICAAALFAIVTISLVGNIITIGDKAAEIHPWVGW